MRVFRLAGLGLIAAFAGIVLAGRMASGQPKSSEGFELEVIAACVLGAVSLTGGIGRISFVIAGSTYEELAAARDRIIAAANENPGIVNLDSDYKETKPHIRIDEHHQFVPRSLGKLPARMLLPRPARRQRRRLGHAQPGVADPSKDLRSAVRAGIVQHDQLEVHALAAQHARDRIGDWPGAVSPPDGGLLPTTERKITNVVLMGMGEPLFNFENVRDGVAIVADGEGLALSGQGRPAPDVAVVALGAHERAPPQHREDVAQEGCRVVCVIDHAPVRVVVEDLLLI